MNLLERLKQRFAEGPKKYSRAEKIERGRRAEQLMNDPLLNEILDEIELGIYQKWRSSKGPEHEGRHNQYLMQRLLDNLRKRMARIAYEGLHESKAEKEERNANVTNIDQKNNRRIA